MRCPMCFTVMECDIYHYATETIKVYRCSKCGYEERHHYVREKPPRVWIGVPARW